MTKPVFCLSELNSARQTIDAKNTGNNDTEVNKKQMKRIV